MKKWMIGLVVIALLAVTLLLSAMTNNSDPALDMTRTAIAQSNSTTAALIQATQSASTAYGASAATPTFSYSGAGVDGDGISPVQAAQTTATALTSAFNQQPDTGGGSSEQSPAPQQERVVIYTADLRIVAELPEAVIKQIETLVEDLGGWIVTSQSGSRNDNKSYGTINVRVPAAQLEYAIETIKSYGVSVTSEKISGSDVTNEYVDMSSRLKNLEATETQLHAIMAEAEDVEAVLAVYMELSRIRGQVESIQGQLNYYDESSSFSSLSVIIDPLVPTPEPYVEPQWNPSEAVDSSLVQLERNIQNLIDGIIHFIIADSPFVLLLLLVGGIFGRIGWAIWKRKS